MSNNKKGMSTINCGVNAATGFCGHCDMLSIQDDNGQWYCIAAEEHQRQYSRHRDEEEYYDELEF